MKQTLNSWSQAQLALTLLSIDPAGLGGMWVRARSGPVRSQFTADLAKLPLPLRKLHPSVGDDVLYEGVDLGATLAQSRVVRSAGLLDSPATLALTMAERCPPALAARLALALDVTPQHCVIALDEGTEDDDPLPAALAARLAFQADLSDMAWSVADPWRPDQKLLRNAKFFLPKVVLSEQSRTLLVTTAVKLGIDDLRAPLMAAKTARLHAALWYREDVAPEDLEIAAQLVYTSRAVMLPERDEQPAPPEPEMQSDTAEKGDSQTPDDIEIPQDILLDAVRANLPDDVLAKLASSKTTRATGNGSGDVQKGNRKGRPLPARAGRLTGQTRIDLIGTLRAAAPWQPIRQSLSPRGHPAPALLIQPSDIRLKRYESKSDRLLIFAVDASGSAAMTRLNEAKGAVELLLAQAYARRDHVALVSFRGQGADILLQPTRSLVQTKRQLAALPGGGGTPLAHGLKTAMEVAHGAKSKGMTPTIALLTDGRANIALDGQANRKDAADDAQRLGQSVRGQNMSALVIDMGNRPERALEALAGTMDAPYIPLPRANAQRLSTAVSAALDG
ncbi:magnesium chelatase subunit D [Algirhabdus cladophorae]|uniref:magnesium chelatase subunit D n=1 Tax=Algirhabdus cladophorae TaxID=3377108 RepID=UPI003B84B164